MKTLNLLTLTLTALCALCSLPAYGEVEASAGADLSTAYVWRGITFNDGMVFQPWMDITNGAFNANVWVNYDIDDYGGTLAGAEYSEIDLTLSWTFDLDPVSLATGIIEYTFPGGATGTTELFVDASMEPMDSLSVGIALYYDIDEVDDYYLSLYGGYSFELAEGLTLDASLALALAGEAYSVSGSDSGMYDMLVSVSIGYELNDNISFAGAVNYTSSLDEDMLPKQDVSTFISAGMTWTF